MLWRARLSIRACSRALRSSAAFDTSAEVMAFVAQLRDGAPPKGAAAHHPNRGGELAAPSKQQLRDLRRSVVQRRFGRLLTELSLLQCVADDVLHLRLR